MPAILSYPKGFNENQRKAYKDLSDDYYEELTRIYGTVMHQEDYRRYQRCGKVTAISALKDVPYQSAGKYKKYRTLDIARMLAKAQVGLNIKGFDETVDVQAISLSVPGFILNYFILLCKKLKLNREDAKRAGQLITQHLNEYSAKASTPK